MDKATLPVSTEIGLRRIGILGCGAIGSRLAKSICHELRDVCVLSGLYDVDAQKAADLEKSLHKNNIAVTSFDQLLAGCDVVVEAINSNDTFALVKKSLQARKDVLSMSVGKLLKAEELFLLALHNHRNLLIPSGAIAGIDAVKSACLAPVQQITLTTRKPVSGFTQNDYLEAQGIDLAGIETETVLFEGEVEDAVRYFPQNINVAATLALASQAKEKLTIRIITSPRYTINSHEIEIVGDFGRMTSLTENVICPDNPKTSYLAVLSAIRTLKDFCTGVRIGT